ncbi:MAG: hypothetical protein HYR85_28115 [Planctomycetes bacterium]|nr:hypothetical protein [Planctomycetota bacterium]
MGGSPASRRRALAAAAFTLGLGAGAHAGDFALGNGDLVVRLGSDGGLREIGARGALRIRASASVPVVGTLEIVASRPEKTVDASTLSWSGDWVPGAAVVALHGTSDSIRVDLRAFLVPGKNLLALRYVVSGDVASLRYVMRFDDATSDVGRTPRMATLATNHALALGVPRIGVGADPPGAAPKALPARTLALQVDRHASATFYVGIGEDAWLDAALLECVKSGVEALDTASQARDLAFLQSGVRIDEPAAWSAVFDRSLLALRDARSDDGSFAGLGGGAAAALALDLAGHGDLSARFGRGRLDRGDADGEVLYDVARHGLATGEHEFLEGAWPAQKRVADGLGARIDATSGLLVGNDDWISPQPGFALWPNAVVVSGLRAAALVAEQLGHGEDAARWRERARTLAGRILTDGFDPNVRRFVPRIGFPGDDRVDSALLNLVRNEWFLPGTGAVGRDEPRFAATIAWIERTLLRVDGCLSRFEANPRGYSSRDGDYEPSARATAWLSEADCIQGWTRDADRSLTAVLASNTSDAPDEIVSALMGFLACVRPGEVAMHLADRPRIALRNVSVPFGRVDLQWERTGGAVRVTVRTRGELPLRVRLRLVPLEGEVIDAVEGTWSRDGRDVLVDVDVPAAGERSIRVSVRAAAPIVRLEHPERWRSPCIVVAGDAARSVRNAAESLREALAIYCSAGPILVNIQSIDIGLAGRDVILVGDPRDEPRLPDEFREAVESLPDAPQGVDEFLLVRRDDSQGNLTVLAGRDERRLVLALDALRRQIRDAALGPLIATDDARLADRTRRLDSLAPGVVREWLVSGPFPIAAGKADSAPLADAPASSVATRAFGELRLADTVPDARPGRFVARVSVRSSTARDAVLSIGTSDAADVYWNDKLGASLVGAREWRLDTDRVPVRLAAGWNRIVVSVTAPTGSASLSARLTDAQGNPLPEIEWRATTGR